MAAGLLEDAKKLHALVDTVQSEKTQVQQALDAEEAKCSRAEKERRRLKEANEALERDTEAAKAQVQRAEQASEEVEAKLATAERENGFLNDEVQRLTKRCNELDNASASNEETAKLSREVHELKQQLVASKEESREQRRLLKEAQDDIQATNHKHRSAHRSVKLATEEKAEALIRSERVGRALEEELEALKGDVKNLHQENKQRAEDLEKTKAGERVASIQLEKVAAQLRQAQETNYKLRDDIESAKDEAHQTSTLRQESELLHETALHEKEVAETARRTLSQVQSDVSKERDAKREMQRELKRARQELASGEETRIQQGLETQRIKDEALSEKSAARVLRNDLQHEVEKVSRPSLRCRKRILPQLQC